MITLEKFRKDYSDYNAKQIIYNALEKQARKENKRIGYYDSNIGSKRKYVVLEEGLYFFNITKPSISFILLDEKELNIKAIKNELDNDSNAPYFDVLVLICLFNAKNVKQSDDSIIVINFDLISQIVEVSEDVATYTASEKSEIADSSSKKSDEYKNEFYNELKNNSEKCAFILGNGVSIAFGADPWERMINNLIDYLTPFYINNPGDINSSLAKSNYLISSFVKKSLFSKCHEEIYYSGIRHCVYRKYHRDMLNKDSLIKSIAITKIKYPGLRILTYNYDTFIENQIKKENPHFLIKTVCKSSRDKYEKSSIYHLHGYIFDSDKKRKNKDCIVLTDDEYFDCYFRKNNWVYSFQKQTLSECKCLYIGSSMSDIFQLSIINDVVTQKGDDWFCYALMCFYGLDEPSKNELIDFYFDRHIKVIYTDTFEQLKEIIYQIADLKD